MGEKTAIQWTDHTFNPWIGCSKVHAGCTHCYAEALATTRLGRVWGPGAERRVTADANWKQPGRWARAAAKDGVRRKVFCASLADVLDEEAPKEARERLWHVIRETAAHLDWQILTKRPERWEVIPADVRPLAWLGTSISDQATADKWVPRLLAAEGFKLRFLSVEPQIGPIDLTDLENGYNALHTLTANPDGSEESHPAPISWVIVGGESGPGARPFDLGWARSIVAQCEYAGVACFVKQLGSKPISQGLAVDFISKKGGDPAEWAPALRIREFPATGERTNG